MAASERAVTRKSDFIISYPLFDFRRVGLCIYRDRLEDYPFVKFAGGAYSPSSVRFFSLLSMALLSDLEE